MIHKKVRQRLCFSVSVSLVSYKFSGSIKVVYREYERPHSTPA
nr:MAG TPA: hypothetical protein [Caudoviricetes sp.]